MPRITASEARSILTPQKVGALSGSYSYSLNPYRGCAFGCSYCYAKEFTHDDQLEASWGKWVRPKINAPELVYKSSRKLAFASVFISSATDPYQPVERQYRLTRACLEVMLSMMPGPNRIHIHTRSPFVVDDIDLMKSFGDRLEVYISITTDNDDIRKIFEPHAPSIPRRLEALRALKSSGIRTGASISPLLPCDPYKLADLLSNAVDAVYIDPIRFPKVVGYGLELYKHNHLQRFLDASYPGLVAETLIEVLGAERVHWRNRRLEIDKVRS